MAVRRAVLPSAAPDPVPRTAVVLLGAGSGSRVGSAVNKVLLPLRDLPVLAWSLRTIAALEYVDHLVVVHREEDASEVADLVRTHLPEGREATLLTGGPTRHASEWRGLQALRQVVGAGGVEVVAIHDGARPLADADLFAATVRTAAEHGGALPARPQPGILDAHGRHRTGLVAVQTPQAFRAAALLDAYTRAEADGFTGTDTAACVAAYAPDLRIHAVPTPATNLKVTFAEDLAVAERLAPSHDAGRGARPVSGAGPGPRAGGGRTRR